MMSLHSVGRTSMGGGLLLTIVLIAPSGCTSTQVNERFPEASERVIRLPGGVLVDRSAREVRVAAEVAIDVGWLEQIACSRGTREHESLLVVDVPPSEVHAALMLIGIEPGRPGSWVFEEIESDRPRIVRIEPEGDLVEVRIAYRDPAGGLVEEPIAGWIAGAGEDRAFPVSPWVFGGSMFRSRRSDRGTVETYVADESGSLVGLVTFGDEVLGLDMVISDQIGIDAVEWEANTGAMPEPGTAVELILRPWAAPLDSPTK